MHSDGSCNVAKGGTTRLFASGCAVIELHTSLVCIIAIVLSKLCGPVSVSSEVGFRASDVIQSVLAQDLRPVLQCISGGYNPDLDPTTLLLLQAEALLS